MREIQTPLRETWGSASVKALFATVLLAISLTPAVAEEAEPAVQYEALLKAYSTASRGFRAAETDVQRKLAVAQLDEYPQKFLDLADKHRTDPAALLALRQAVQAVISVDSLAQQSWEMNREAFAAGSQSDSASRIVRLLLRDHLESEQLGPICDRMRWGIRKEFQEFLSAVLEMNPHRNVRGMACLALAQLLRNHLHVADRVTDRPEWIKRYEDILGKEYLQTLRGSGRTTLEERVEALYERATEFDDVTNIPFSETVAEKAKTELFDIRHLSVGKLAPDIEGQDQDGEQLKLSDYRGKVVLFYFWSQY